MCKCQGCGKEYSVDIIVPDSLWEIIKPPKKHTGAGLLCGECMMKRIENISNYDHFNLLKHNEFETINIWEKILSILSTRYYTTEQIAKSVNISEEQTKLYLTHMIALKYTIYIDNNYRYHLHSRYPERNNKRKMIKTPSSMWWENHMEELKNMKTNEFATKYNLASSTVSGWKNKLGLVKDHKDGTRRIWWESKIDELRTLRTTDFAIKYKIDPSQVSKWKKILGL